MTDDLREETRSRSSIWADALALWQAYCTWAESGAGLMVWATHWHLPRPLPDRHTAPHGQLPVPEDEAGDHGMFA